MYIGDRKFNKLTFIVIFCIVVSVGRAAGVAGGVAEWSSRADDIGNG